MTRRSPGVWLLLLFLPVHSFVQDLVLSRRKLSFLAASKRARSERQTSPLAEKPATGQRKKKNQTKNSQNQQRWRVFGVEVHPDELVGDKEGNDETVPKAVLQSLTARLKTSRVDNVVLVRRSLDARYKRRTRHEPGPRFVYVLDVTVPWNECRSWKSQPGRLEHMPIKESTYKSSDENGRNEMEDDVPTVIIVGAGPAGLFCALELIKSGLARPIVLERGQPVEVRGKDIGALMHRRHMNTESNFAFGEGGAGTWSDGKLTTRIGRNSNAVRQVLETLVEYGAPKNILTEGAPHLGTDNLVRLLQNMRIDLRRLGGEIHFGTKVTGYLFDDNNNITGVEYQVSRATKERLANGTPTTVEASGKVQGDAVVLATGHSARDVYEKLHAAGVQLDAKGFAVGFRIEHPQKIINKIQYGMEWGPTVVTGKRPTDAANEAYFASSDQNQLHHTGKLPVPSYRLATDKAFDGKQFRGVYSFCMCPGGQIVPASTDPNEVCVNGMSFSRRDSQWANSALVVTVNSDDEILKPYRQEHGVLAGLAFQKDMERRASEMGGGGLTVPVQRVSDFLSQRPSTTAPPSSYRLGVKPAACHEIFPKPLMQSMRHALTDHFQKQMPGYVCDEALLHGVETRTSSPVRVARDRDSMQAIGTSGLFPAGEGAGFAGGIVSAAVDGIVVAQAVIDCTTVRERTNKQESKKGNVGTFY